MTKTGAARQKDYRDRLKREQERNAVNLAAAVERSKNPPLHSYPRKEPDVQSKLDKALVFENEAFIKDIPAEPPLPVLDAPVFNATAFNVPILKTDRDEGLPRSNYNSDHDAPGGWRETIRNMHPHLVTKILDRVAPPRKMR